MHTGVTYIHNMELHPALPIWRVHETFNSAPHPPPHILEYFNYQYVGRWNYRCSRGMSNWHIVLFTLGAGVQVGAVTSVPSYYKETTLSWKCDVSRPIKGKFNCARAQEAKDICPKLMENGEEPKVYTKLTCNLYTSDITCAGTQGTYKAVMLLVHS